MKTLSILFAGEAITARLLDKSEQPVFVRALPLRHMAHVLSCCEDKHRLIELCTYVKAEPVAAMKDATALPPAFPDVTPPAGYEPVPIGWCDNLDDESVDTLYELAQSLNFQRAANWAKGQIAAKKKVAPLHEAAIAQVMPIFEKITAPLLERIKTLSALSPSAASSSAPAEKTS